MSSTKLVGQRPPTKFEDKRGAETVFIRKDKAGRAYEIFASYHTEHGAWEQWGAPTEILSENVSAMDVWGDEQARIFLEKENAHG